MKYSGIKKYHLDDLHHWPFVSVLQERLANSDSQDFHHEPFELFWKPTDDSVNIQIHDKLYTLSPFLEAYCALQEFPGELGCDLSRVVAAMMFWLDGTHLTSFGNAKLHPCYLFFDNDSKYQRCKLTCHLSSHVAYFQTVGLHFYFRCCMAIWWLPQLPDEFNDFIIQHTDEAAPSKALLTHCHHEVMHAQWKILLDDEFVEAYAHGIVIECYDGIKCQFYPCILTYSADHPEK
jgi:hypothetical protein